MIARGAKIATITIIHPIDRTSGPATGPPSISPRVASITDVTGFHSANVLSNGGMVEGGANAELAKVSGKMIMKPSELTDSVDLARMPT